MPQTGAKTRPRVLAYVNRNFPFSILPRLDLANDPDFQILEVHTSIENFYILYFYNERPTMGTDCKLTFDRFLGLEIPLKKPFLLLGDMNLHHSMWNPARDSFSPTASTFVDFLEVHEALLIMDSQVIEDFGGTFQRSNTKQLSIIDLAFSVKFQALHWGNWRYAQSSGSDHEAICFSATLNHDTFKADTMLPQGYNLKKGNWIKYVKLLKEMQPLYSQHLNLAIAESDYERIAFLLQDIITSAATKSIPRSKPCSRSKAWWTTELSDLRKTYHRKRRLAKNIPTHSHMENARVARNIYFEQSHTRRVSTGKAF